MKFTSEAIGIIHSPYKTPQEIPSERQSSAGEAVGKLEIFPAFASGLRNIDGFSHLFVIFRFHRNSRNSLTVYPPFDKQERGVFSTRSPHRPNNLGLTIVRLLARKDNILEVAGIDMIDGTPILDIKPYTERDRIEQIRIGWLEPYRKQS